MREITWSVNGATNVLLQSFSSTSIHRMGLQSWAYTAVFSNICTAHAQDRLLMNFRCKFRHRRSIRRPRFPIRVQNFGDLATFSVDFCILYAECPPYFYFRFVWPTDRASILHALTPTTIIPTKFEVDMTICCRVIAFLSADTSRDLVTLTFDLEQLSYMVGHVANLVTKFEDLTPIRSSVTSYNVSRWIPLKMRTRPLRMRRITWAVSRGSKTITFFKSPTPICIFTMQLRWHYDESN